MKNIILYLYLFCSFFALCVPIKQKTEIIKGFVVKIAVIDVGMKDSENGNNPKFEKHDHIHGEQVVRTILDINPCAKIYKYNYNPKSLKNFEDTFEMVLETRPHIINVSSSGPVHSLRERKLFNRAASLGIVVVVAAGNEGQRITEDFKPYPLSYRSKSMISVGSLDFKDNIADFSNYGEGVDIYKKGRVNVRINNLTYAFSGTSASTAIVSAELSKLISPLISPVVARNNYLKKTNSFKINRNIAGHRSSL